MAQKQTKPVTPIKKTITPVAPAKPVERAAPVKQPVAAQPVNFVFDKGNYKFFIISIAVVAFGFVLMSGTTDIYSTTKIVIAPLVVLAGFGLGFFAIFKKPEVKA
jgi:type IV secretory pathway VirB2 component (pilin)